jgi:hypothetical protein
MMLRCLNLLLLLLLLAYLGAEGVGIALKSLSHRFLSYLLVLQIILAGVAVTAPSDTVVA